MNKVVLLGRICKDLELRYSQSGTAFSSFSLAVNRKFKKEGEEQQADFINCKVFGKTCEFMGKYMGKGSQIALEGRIQTGSYEKDGQKVYTTDVMIDEVYFADSKKSDNGNQDAEPISDGFIPMTSDDTLPF
jgi:single-strand DNA-binding protein